MGLSIYCVTPAYTLKEALDQISENHNRNVFVVDEGKVVGILSQGDAVRALCRGADILQSISGLYSPTFFYLRSRDMSAAKELVKDKGVTLIPVVDEGFSLVDVITPADVIASLEEEVQ